MIRKLAALLTHTDKGGEDLEQRFQFFRINYGSGKASAAADNAEKVVLDYLAGINERQGWSEAWLLEFIVQENSPAYEQLRKPTRNWIELDASRCMEEME